MSENLSSLVTVPQPILDESPASWLMRVCQLHDVWPTKLFRIVKVKVMEDFDRELELKHLEILVRGTVVEKEKLVCLNRKFQHVRDEPLSSAFLLSTLSNKGFYRYCPGCLATDEVPYWRFTWRLSYYIFCPVHRCQLQSRCCACEQRLTPIREQNPIFESDLSFFCFCPACGFDLRNGISSAVEPSEGLQHVLELQRAITAAVLCGYHTVQGIDGHLPLSALPKTLLMGGRKYDGTHICEPAMLPVFQQFLMGSLPIARESWQFGSVASTMRKALHLRWGRLVVDDICHRR